MRGISDERSLARVHRLALQLAALGAGDELVADCLGIEPEAVAPLVKVAAAKAAAAGLIVDLADATRGEVRRHHPEVSPGCP